MERTVLKGTLSKYSLGRGIGINPRNWKSRFFKLTTQSLSYMESTEDSVVKFECPISAISVLFCDPGKADHPEAVGPGSERMFALRVFDNGAYTLLAQAENREEKERWLQALKETIPRRSKGFQIVLGDGEVVVSSIVTGSASADASMIDDWKFGVGQQNIGGGGGGGGGSDGNAAQVAVESTTVQQGIAGETNDEGGDEAERQRRALLD